MKYKNPFMRNIKNAFPLEVCCNFCKTPILMYQKVGRGNLLKIQLPRIIESEVDLRKLENSLDCTNCGEQLASLSDHKGNPTYFTHRGKIYDRRRPHYRY